MHTLSDVNLKGKKRTIFKSGNWNARGKYNIFVFVLAIFITVASIQTFALSDMLSEAKSIGDDIGTIRANQESLFEQYYNK